MAVRAAASIGRFAALNGGKWNPRERWKKAPLRAEFVSRFPQKVQRSASVLFLDEHVVCVKRGNRKNWNLVCSTTAQ